MCGIVNDGETNSDSRRGAFSGGSLLLYIGLACLVGLALRWSSVDYGLPYAYRHDEPIMIRGALKMGAERTFSPAMTEYPALYLYMLTGSYGALFAAGKLLGVYSSAAAFGARYILDPSIFFVVGRGLSVAFAVLSIAMTVVVGARMFGRAAGAFAGFLLACSVVHIDQSVLSLPNIPMTAFSVLALVPICRVYERGRLSDYLLSGILVGVSVGFKYNTGLLALPLIIAHFLGKGRSHGRLLLALVLVPVVFLCLNPYWILAFDRYYSAFAFQASHMKLGHVGHYLGPPYLWYFAELVKSEWLAAPVMLGGVACAIYRRRAQDWILLSYLVPTMALILPLKNQGLDYTIGVTPVLAILGGRAVSRLGKLSRERFGRRVTAAAVVAFLILIILPPLRRAVNLELPDTRTMARDWIYASLPEGSHVVIDREEYSPQLYRLDYVEGRARGMEFLRGDEEVLRQLKSRRGYDVIGLRYEAGFMEWPEETPREIRNRYGDEPYVRGMLGTGFKSRDELPRAGDVYFVESSCVTKNWDDAALYPEESPIRYQAFREREKYRRLLEGAELVHSWEPVPDSLQGPALRLYRLRNADEQAGDDPPHRGVVEERPEDS